MTPTRLQLGVSRLEFLPDECLRVFLDKQWVHLGEPQPGLLRSLVWKVRNLRRGVNAARLYEQTNFMPFRFDKNGRLPFADSSMSFIFSEHFFEHLWPEETKVLLAECNRVLDRGGVIRVSVPDAVLRTYEPPEPEGFPVHLPADHPDKHKVRWTVYSLSDALRGAGFEAEPIRFCDRQGKYEKREPRHEPDLTYLRRPDSLIVDGVKH